MKAIVVTLAYRHFAQAMFSQAKAASSYGKKLDWIWLYGKPQYERPANAYQVVTDKYIEARDYFLRGDWDTFIAVEDDMIIPEHSFSRIEENLACCDVLYGVYVLRTLSNQYALTAYSRLEEDTGDSLVASDSSLSKKLLAEGGLWASKGVGMGLTAIKRHVLEAIAFEKRDKFCNDWYFAVDCQKQGFMQVHDFGLQAGHMSLEPSPRILWPDAEKICRIEYL